MLEARSEKVELIISAIGNMLVWYNFALFMPFLPILSKHFFPIADPAIRNVVTFCAMSMGLFLRPVGSLIFGPIGDKIGREKSISLAILLMAVPTFLIGLLPSYNQIGILSPILMIFLRSLQGISMGGEYTTAMVHLVELAPKDKKGFFGSFSDAGSQIGVLLAGEVLLSLHVFFSESDIYQYAWRIPFFLSVVLVPFAFLHSEKKTETISTETESKNIKDKDKKNQESENKKNNKGLVSVLAGLSEYKTEVACTIAITAFSATAFYTFLTFLPYYLVTENILSLKETTFCSVIANFSIICSILFHGFLSDKFPRRIFLEAGMILVTLTTYFMFLGNITSSFMWIIVHIVYGIFLGMYYGSRSAFFAESFPKEVRCTGVSFSLSIAQAFFGGSISIVLNYCMSISHLAVNIPITIIVIGALLAVSKIVERRKHQFL